MSWKTNAMMEWAGNKITDHNRSPLEISIERIEKKQRMVDGTLRRYTVAKKRTFSCTWEMLPDSNAVAGAGTVDGGWAAAQIESFHNSTDGPFTLTLKAGKDISLVSDGEESTYEVMISDFSKDIQKRGVVDFWNISITLEEV